MLLFDWSWSAWTSLGLLFSQPATTTTRPQPINFHLRAIHSVASSEPRIIFADPAPGLLETTFTIPTRQVTTYRPQSHELLSRIRRGSVDQMTWVEDSSIGPDVENRQTLLSLARMTYNAYLPDENKTDWYDLEHWKQVRSMLPQSSPQLTGLLR